MLWQLRVQPERVVHAYCQHQSAVALGSSDQVVATGDGTSDVTASCPVGRSILFGVAMQTTSDPGDVTCVVGNAATPGGASMPCPLGGSSCTLPACDSPGLDHAVVAIVCAVDGPLVTPAVSGLVTVHRQSASPLALTAACPLSTTLAWSFATRWATPAFRAALDDADAGARVCLRAASAMPCHAGAATCSVPPCSTPTNGTGTGTGVGAVAANHTTAVVSLVCMPSASFAATEVVTVAGLTASQQLRLRAVATSSEGSSSSNSPALSLATGESTVPGVPSGVAMAAATGGMVEVTWLPPLDSGGGSTTSFRVGVGRGACESSPSASPNVTGVVTDGLTLWLDAARAASFRQPHHAGGGGGGGGDGGGTAADNRWHDVSGAGVSLPAVATGTTGAWQTVSTAATTVGSTVLAWEKLGLSGVGALRVVFGRPMTNTQRVVYAVSVVAGAASGDNPAAEYGAAKASTVQEEDVYVGGWLLMVRWCPRLLVLSKSSPLPPASCLTLVVCLFVAVSLHHDDEPWTNEPMRPAHTGTVPMRQ